MILVTGAARLEPKHLRQLEDLGYKTSYMQWESDRLPVRPSLVDAVLCNSLFEHHPLDSFSGLKFVQSTSAGLDRVPLSLLEDRGIAVRRAEGVYSPAIAEFVILQLLQLVKKSPALLASQAQRVWKKERGLKELEGLSACIVGRGSIGGAISSRLLPFGVHVDAVGRLTPASEVDDKLSSSDIVILSLPLTGETFHFMDARRLSLMRKDSILINVARGQLVDELALIELLEAGHFYGVGLDVFEDEPLSPVSPLWGYDRVLVTPHNAFVSNKATDRLMSLFVRNLSELL